MFVFCLALEGIGVLHYGRIHLLFDFYCSVFFQRFFIFIFFLFYIVSFNCNLIFKVVINVSFQNWLEIHFHFLSLVFPCESLVLFFYTEFHSYPYSKILFNVFSSFLRYCSHEISEFIEFLKGYIRQFETQLYIFPFSRVETQKRRVIFYILFFKIN